MTNEKRGNFPGLSLPTRKHSGDSGHLPTKIKNFFRINSSSSHSSHGGSPVGNDREREKDSPKNEKDKSTFRQSRFLPTIGRNRSTTVASEGNPLDDGVSPTATANPYFAHQGQPALRHRNDGSAPSSPPDTPELQVTGVSAVEQATTANKEELARKLRRVASAPNAQGLFNSQGDGRPQTAEMGKEPLVETTGPDGTVGLPDGKGGVFINTTGGPFNGFVSLDMGRMARLTLPCGLHGTDIQGLQQCQLQEHHQLSPSCRHRARSSAQRHQRRVSHL